MTMAQQFAGELTREAATTRRVLERVPEAQIGWRPHAKSMSLGQLAYHIAGLPRAICNLIAELESGTPVVKVPEGVPVAEILATHDASLAFAVEQLHAWGDEDLGEIWRMKSEGKTLLEMPRAGMVRAIMLNHTYHHRGQLTVYLRMLDVPLPPIYGPTADANLF
jgi:uncharacterized damage-inducible protein DinB